MFDIGSLPLRYLIGADDTAPDPLQGGVVEYSYDKVCFCRVKYGTLTSEKERFKSLEDANGKGAYAPYLPATDITGDYGEWMPDPRGPGFMANVEHQIHAALAQHAEVIELDNPDFEGLDQAYLMQVLDVVYFNHLASVCKNPLNVANPEKYAAHPSIAFVVVEEGDYNAADHEALRQNIGKPLLPIRFVTFGNRGHDWGKVRMREIMAKRFLNMGVTWSSKGEYGNSVDMLKPLVSV